MYRLRSKMQRLRRRLRSCSISPRLARRATCDSSPSRSSNGSEFLAAIALKIEKGGEIAVVDAYRRFRLHLGFGVEGDANPRLLQHWNVVGAVANRDGVPGRDR